MFFGEGERLFLVASGSFRYGREGGGDFTSLELTKIWIKGTVTNKGQDYETMRMRLYGMYFPSCELKFSVASCRICGGRENELARLWGLGKKTVSEYGFNADTS